MPIYPVDDQDTVRPLLRAPQSCPGAPCPAIVCDEHRLFLAYYVNRPESGWDGTWVRIVGPATKGRQVAVIEFASYHAYMFGPPNDEAFHGHPLASRGLEPYGAYVVDRSSWVRRLERLNSVHDMHRPEAFDSVVHYVFAFHDSTFECAASEEPAFQICNGSIRSVIGELGQRLG